MRIVVDTHAATYPVTVDPTWTSSSAPTARLTNRSGSAGAVIGYGVALSADGTTAPAGSVNTNTAYLFHVASLSAWSGTISTPTATFTDASLLQLGRAVALSSDGATALVGAPHSGAGTGLGSADIWHVPSASDWGGPLPTPATLTNGAAPLGNYNFGFSVALSSDGTTALIGACQCQTAGGVPLIGPGAACIFQASSQDSWPTTSRLTATLTNGHGVTGDALGRGVALSSDGEIALAAPAAVSPPINPGAAYIFGAPNHKLRVVKRGSGTVTSSPAGITCGATCHARFFEGQTVSLLATPDPGSVFAGWSAGACSGTGTCRLTISADPTVTATFSRRSPPPTRDADLSLTKTASVTAVRPGGQVIYTLAVDDHGPGHASGVTVKVAVPAGLSE